MSRFESGKSGNPAGRPKGSRNKLSEEFIEALFAEWQQHGPAAVTRVREDDPVAFLKIVAGLVPREIHLTENPLSDMTDAQLVARLRLLDAELKPWLEAFEREDDAKEDGPTAH